MISEDVDDDDSRSRICFHEEAAANKSSESWSFLQVQILWFEIGLL